METGWDSSGCHSIARLVKKWVKPLVSWLCKCKERMLISTCRASQTMTLLMWEIEKICDSNISGRIPFTSRFLVTFISEIKTLKNYYSESNMLKTYNLNKCLSPSIVLCCHCYFTMQIFICKSFTLPILCISPCVSFQSHLSFSSALINIHSIEIIYFNSV